MKKIEILIGSPRKKGNTFSMAEILKAHLNEETSIVNLTFLYDFDIKPCTDCRACKKGKLECVLNDDMKKLYPRLETADTIIIGTPIYWFGPTAQTKLLIDRFRPYFVNKKLSGKQIALLLPAGTGAIDCDLTMEMVERVAEALKLNFPGAVTAKAYDVGDVENDDEVRELISELAAKLNETTKDL